MNDKLSEMSVTMILDDGNETQVIDVETVQALITEARIEQKIDTLITTDGHQQTGTEINSDYFSHNINMLEKELAQLKENK